MKRKRTRTHSLDPTLADLINGFDDHRDFEEIKSDSRCFWLIVGIWIAGTALLTVVLPQLA